MVNFPPTHISPIGSICMSDLGQIEAWTVLAVSVTVLFRSLYGFPENKQADD